MCSPMQLCFSLYLTILAVELANGRNESPPNILLFMADDVGMGDIGCFGNDTIRTPNIDRICSNGVKLNHNLAAASLCTPSRAAFLTGRYPVRFGYVSQSVQESRVTIFTSATGGLPPEEKTFADLFKDIGYMNGYFGKWHLGVHCGEKDFCHFPLNNGFHYYYGMPLTNLEDFGPWSMFGIQSELFTFPDITKWYISIAVICYTYLFVKIKHKLLLLLFMFITFCFYFQNVFLFFFHRQFNCILMENYEIIQQPVQLQPLTSNVAKAAKEFIRNNSKVPFLAVVAFHKAHTALATSPQFEGRSRHGKYGDCIEELDWAVGEIIAELESQALINNTIIYFTSDHGPALYATNLLTGEYHGGWRGIYRGGKAYNYEGGIRVPTIVQWSGAFPAGSVVDRPTSLLDVYPTLLSLANIPQPNNVQLDGIDISGMLYGGGEEDRVDDDRFLLHYCGSSLHAVTLESRSDSEVWKVHFVVPKIKDDEFGSCFGDYVQILDRPVIYGLRSNPREDSPLSFSDPNYSKVLQKVLSVVSKHQSTMNTSVASQLTRDKNVFSWKRAMCCNYPFCSC